MTKTILRTLLATAAVLPLAGGAWAQEAARTDLVIADLGQPETNPWVINRHRFERCVAEALGVELKEFDDQNSEEQHVAQAESIIAGGPDGLIFNPLTSPAGIQVARLLEANDIPGVAVGRLVVSNYDSDYEGEDFIAQVTQNNDTWGQAIGKATADLGHKKVAMIWNQKGVTSAEEIWAGVQSELDKAGVEVIAEAWDRLNRENGQKYAEQYIARFAPGEIDAIIVLGAVAGLGSQFATDQAERDDIAIITTDIDEQVAQFIEEGKLDFSIGGHWMVGGFGLIQLYDYLHGHPIENTQPRVGLIPVTAENVDTYASSLLNGCILSPDTIRSLSKVHNPDADLPGFIDAWQANWQNHVQ
ncbi:MAG: sugar ABC transporter substrate-binding protein [Roseibium sp.]|uniref:sugar ABC transporter substrate-binding protein n=1 Tax=Roseibium sp. TaxID=1936156 RepID=UPI00261F034F|nr:sugar ABC transporter substrate-binding protein [Roseibium sp.]MCV0423936.1 sugar ABC transporter substrate-binding protein [Roseibium sp.]